MSNHLFLLFLLGSRQSLLSIAQQVLQITLQVHFLVQQDSQHTNYSKPSKQNAAYYVASLQAKVALALLPGSYAPDADSRRWSEEEASLIAHMCQSVLAATGAPSEISNASVTASAAAATTTSLPRSQDGTLGERVNAAASATHSLWLLLLQAYRLLLDCRKRDVYHFRTHYRISYVILRIHELLTPPSSTSPSTSMSSPSISSSSSTSFAADVAALLGDQRLQITPGSESNTTAIHVDLNSNRGTDDRTDTIQTATDIGTITMPPAIHASFVELGVDAFTKPRALVEIHKLFEKKRAQMVAMWSVDNPVHPWDQLLARSMEFDALRRKV